MNKDTMNILMFMVGGEIIILLLFVSVFLIYKSIRRRKLDNNAAQSLLKNIHKGDDSRRKKLLEVFGDCYDLKDDELEKVVDEFIAREHAFYKTMISVYVNNDAAEFAKLKDVLEDVIEPYSDLALSSEQSNQRELEEVKSINSELQSDLDANKKVIEQLMAEYSRSFDKKTQENKDTAEEQDKEESAEGKSSEAGDEQANSGDSQAVGSEDLDQEDDEDLDFSIDLDDTAGGGEEDNDEEDGQLTDDIDLIIEDDNQNATAAVPESDVDLVAAEQEDTTVADTESDLDDFDDIDLIADEMNEEADSSNEVIAESSSKPDQDEKVPDDQSVEDDFDLIVEEASADEAVNEGDELKSSNEDIDLEVEEDTEQKSVNAVDTEIPISSKAADELIAEVQQATPKVKDQAALSNESIETSEDVNPDEESDTDLDAILDSIEGNLDDDEELKADDDQDDDGQDDELESLLS